MYWTLMQTHPTHRLAVIMDILNEKTKPISLVAWIDSLFDVAYIPIALRDDLFLRNISHA